jgi:hypothetical protein
MFPVQFQSNSPITEQSMCMNQGIFGKLIVTFYVVAYSADLAKEEQPVKNRLNNK